MSYNGVLRAVLVALDAFTAVTATGGGIALTSGLEADRFPIEFLRATPFRSYRLPGAILGAAVGGSAAVAAASGLRRSRAVWLASALAGTVLMGWIVGEVLILRKREARSWVDAADFALGLLMATSGVVMWLVDHRQPRTMHVPASASPN
jgi:hypothetical protein